MDLGALNKKMKIRNVLMKGLAYNRRGGCDDERPMYPRHELLKFLATR